MFWPSNGLIAHIFFVDLATLTVQTEEVGNTEQSISISWVDPNESNRLYQVTVVNSVSRQWTFAAQEPYFHFTAPEGAPPCEVYNFSVTATYVGATYTGAGCSVASQVLSAMLPSLPIIDDFQSSYNVLLEKQAEEAVLTVYFQVNGLFRFCFIVSLWDVMY
jgi:hypothetical protein